MPVDAGARPRRPVRRYATPHTLSPRAHLLSNGSYTVMVTNAGGGYSRRQDAGADALARGHHHRRLGQLLYVRDLDTRRGLVDDATSRRGGSRTSTRSTFAPDRAVWRRVDDGIETRTEVVVSPEDDAELRRVSITNHSHRARSLELTSYAEVVLAPADADLAHPAFSNLFVETIAVPERDALICARRPRAGTDRVCTWFTCSAAAAGSAAPTRVRDRSRALHRPRPHARAAGGAVPARRRSSNTTGAGARSDRQPAPVDPPSARRHRAARVHDRLRRQRGRGARS